MTTEPVPVSKFEYYLLRILQSILLGTSSDKGVDYLFQACPEPKCLSAKAVATVETNLSRGCVAYLSHAGWQRSKHIHGEKTTEGRVWERHGADTLSLKFSAHTMRFLIWLTAEDLAQKTIKWLPMPVADLTIADRFFFFLTYKILRRTEMYKKITRRDMFTTNALCRLMYPDDFVEVKAKKLPKMELWVEGDGSYILEALQTELCQSWTELERRKANISEWQAMQALGNAQTVILQVFLQALEDADRRDLARFLLQTLAAVLPEDPQILWWTSSLKYMGKRIADRQETMQAALALLRQIGRLHKWQQQAQLVRFFDETFQISQLWKQDWEHWQGDTLAQRAQTLLDQIQPL